MSDDFEIPDGLYRWDVDFPVFVHVFPDWYGIPGIGTMISNATDRVCLLVFTDEDLAERHAVDMGWSEVKGVLKIETVQELHQFCEQFPESAFSGIAFDMWKGNSKCQTTRDSLAQIARDLNSGS